MTNTPLVYVLKSDKYYKIGRTTSSAESRVRNLQHGNPILIELHSIYLHENSLKLEKYLHDVFSSKLIRGEWYELSGYDVGRIPSHIITFNSLFCLDN